MRRAALMGALLGALGCSEEPTPPVPEAPAVAAQVPDVDRGVALLERFECARCHGGERLEPVAQVRSCVGCHQAIHAGEFDAPAADQRRWRRNLVSLNHAPALGRRLRPEWIERFLLAPYDVRPGLPATMPRLPITEAEAADLAAALTAGAPQTDEASPPAPRIAEGVALLRARGCTDCHAYGGVLDSRPTLSGAAAELAPDLRHARDRMTRGTLRAWLEDPASVQPGTLMPTPELTDDERAAVLDALILAELAPVARCEVPARLPVLERPVRFDEVQERVFSRTCWHCHADPDFAMGDGGAGNTGGFGYPGRGVNLLDYAGASSGYLDDDGERRSIFADDDGVPHLVRVLMARYRELAGHPDAGVTGMPLGFPPVSLEDIQLVESWIAQGRPN